MKRIGFGISVQPLDWRLGFVQPKWAQFTRLYAFGPLRFAWQW